MGLTDLFRKKETRILNEVQIYGLIANSASRAIDEKIYLAQKTCVHNTDIRNCPEIQSGNLAREFEKNSRKSLHKIIDSLTDEKYGDYLRNKNLNKKPSIPEKGNLDMQTYVGDVIHFIRHYFDVDICFYKDSEFSVGGKCTKKGRGPINDYLVEINHYKIGEDDERSTVSKINVSFRY